MASSQHHEKFLKLFEQALDTLDAQWVDLALSNELGQGIIEIRLSDAQGRQAITRLPVTQAALEAAEAAYAEARRQRRLDAIQGLQDSTGLEEACRLLRAHVPFVEGSPVAKFLEDHDETHP